MFTDQIEAEDFSKMPEEYRTLLSRVLRIQADCEIGGPHLYVSQWLLSAPTAEDQWKVAKTAAEEIEHFHKINQLLNQIGMDASDRLFVQKADRYVDAFRREMPTWADWAVFGMLIDRVGQFQLDEFVDCSYLPLARLLPPHDNQILEEEQGHVNFGLLKVMELGRTDEGREQVQAAVNRWYVTALDMFGRTESRRSKSYIEWGIKRRTNLEARHEYITEVNPILEKLGLDIPDADRGRKFV